METTRRKRSLLLSAIAITLAVTILGIPPVTHASGNIFTATAGKEVNLIGASLITPNYSYCTGATTCSAIGSVTSGDEIIVAFENAGSGSLSDSLGFTYGGIGYSATGITEQVHVNYARATSSGPDTFTVSASSSGTIAIEAFDITNLPAGFTTSYKTGHCGSSCGTGLSTASLTTPYSSFGIASLFASPGSGSYPNCGGTAGSGFYLACGTFNPWTGSESRTFTAYGSTNFPATDNTTPSQWIELGMVFSNPSFTSITTSWLVPAAPTGTFNNNAVQDVSLWSGLEDPGTPLVVQPILAYGCAGVNLYNQCILGGQYWWITAWVQTSNSNHQNGAVYQVSQGDSLTGSVTYSTSNSGCSGGPGYTVQIVDNTSPSKTSSSTYCTSETMGIAEAMVLEGYNLNSCNQLPNASSESFSISSLTPSSNIMYDNSAYDCSSGYYWSSSTTGYISWSTSGTY